MSHVDWLADGMIRASKDGDLLCASKYVTIYRLTFQCNRDNPNDFFCVSQIVFVFGLGDVLCFLLKLSTIANSS